MGSKFSKWPFDFDLLTSVPICYTLKSIIFENRSQRSKTEVNVGKQTSKVRYKKNLLQLKKSVDF